MPERRFRRLAALAALTATVHGLVYVPFVDPHTTQDTPSYTAAAEAILDGHYSTPLGATDITGAEVPPSARGVRQRETYRTPGYPLLLVIAGGARMEGESLSVFMVQALLLGAATWLLALAARRLWGPRAALLAAAVYALDPFSKRYVSLLLTEALASALALAIAYAFVRARQDRSLGWWAGCGALSAALSLTRPVFVLVVPLAALAALLSERVRSRGVVAAAAVGVSTLVLLAPWLAWTGTVTGRLALSSFGEGWNLLLAAHGEGLRRTSSEVQSDPAFGRDFYSVRVFAPSADELRGDPNAHGRHLIKADAVHRDRARRLYWKRLSEEPAEVAGEVAYRGYFLWMAHEDWYQPREGLGLLALRLVDWVALGLATLGAALAVARGGIGRALVVFLLTFTLLNALHHVEARYAIPVRGLFLALAALALLFFYDRLAARAPFGVRPATSSSTRR